MHNKYIIRQDGLIGNEMEIVPSYSGRLFGPELEYFTVKKVNGVLVPVNIIDEFKKSKYFAGSGKTIEELQLKIKPELTNEQIELDAPPEKSLSAIESNLTELVNEALNIVSDCGARLLPAALYPLDFEFTVYPSDRYKFLIQNLGHGMKKNAPRVTSDQINVGGIDEADSFKVFNFLRQTLPFLVGFGVASPYVDCRRGEDLCERIRIYNNTLQRFPELAGLPSEINSLDEYILNVEQLPIIQHPNLYYKFIRPMPQRGVAGEIRVIDKQPTIKEYLAFVALTKGLLNNMKEFQLSDFLIRDFYSAVKNGIYDKGEFLCILDIAEYGLPEDEKGYLDPLRIRLDHGTIAEKLINHVEHGGASISEAYETLCESVELGVPYI